MNASSSNLMLDVRRWSSQQMVRQFRARHAVKEGHYEIVFESSCHGMFGVPWNGDTIQPPVMNRFFSLASADLVVLNEET